MQFNKAFISGNLTRDPETKFLANDKQVTSFSLACNRKFKDKEEVSFFDFECWGKTAELAAKHLSKGSSVFLECRPVQDRWEQDGKKRSKVKFVVDRLHFNGPKQTD